MVRLFSVRSAGQLVGGVWAHSDRQATLLANQAGFVAPQLTPTREVRGWGEDRASEFWFSTGADGSARVTPLMELHGTKRVA